MKASIYDVAKQAGVSVVTVSRVINGVKTVRTSSKEKVFRAIEDLGYQPSAAARTLAKGRTNVIGMLVPGLMDPFLMGVVKSADRALQREGMFLALSILEEEKAPAEWGNFLFQEDRVDGILLLTPVNERACVEQLKLKQIPFVIIDNQLYPYTELSVVVDNYFGGYEAGKAFIETGHKQIAHIGGPEDIQSANERCSGFLKALEEVGSEPFGLTRGEFSVEAGIRFVEEAISRGTLPDAIFAADDYIAFGVIDALRKAGFSVPEDVSVIGFDDHPFCSSLRPRLTTFAQPAEKLGETAVAVLMQRIRGEAKRHTVTKMLPKLIWRDSVKERI